MEIVKSIKLCKKCTLFIYLFKISKEGFKNIYILRLEGEDHFPPLYLKIFNCKNKKVLGLKKIL